MIEDARAVADLKRMLDSPGDVLLGSTNRGRNILAER
jgi:hypothetical protein